MQPLITRNDIAQYRQISKTPNDAKLNEMIIDAQLMDIIPLLGEKLYNKVATNPDAYPDLLNGCVYEKEGISYTNYGLKMTIAYYAYARYIMFGSVTDTPYSFVEKASGESRPVEASVKKSIYQNNREAAQKVWQSVHNWLLRTNAEDYSKSCSSGTVKNGMRFTKIK